MYGTWTSPGRGPTGECSGQPTPVVLREHLSERDPSGRSGWRPARAHHVPGLLRIAPLSPSRVPPRAPHHRDRFRPRPALGLPRTAVTQSRSGERAAGAHIRAPAPAARPLRAAAPPPRAEGAQGAAARYLGRLPI